MCGYEVSPTWVLDNKGRCFLAFFLFFFVGQSRSSSSVLMTACTTENLLVCECKSWHPPPPQLSVSPPTLPLTERRWKLLSASSRPCCERDSLAGSVFCWTAESLEYHLIKTWGRIHFLLSNRRSFSLQKREMIESTETQNKRIEIRMR